MYLQDKKLDKSYSRFSVKIVSRKSEIISFCCKLYKWGEGVLELTKLISSFVEISRMFPAYLK